MQISFHKFFLQYDYKRILPATDKLKENTNKIVSKPEHFEHF